MSKITPPEHAPKKPRKELIRYTNGMSDAAIAEKVGCTAAAIARYCRKKGWYLRRGLWMDRQYAEEYPDEMSVSEVTKVRRILSRALRVVRKECEVVTKNEDRTGSKLAPQDKDS
jgi:hypothetical protein